MGGGCGQLWVSGGTEATTRLVSSTATGVQAVPTGVLFGTTAKELRFEKL